MGSGTVLPWRKINEFIEEIGSSENDGDFIRTVMNSVQKLVQFDLSCVFALLDSTGTICPARSYVYNSRRFDEFVAYYWNKIPDMSRESGDTVKTIDWERYSDTEYAADFMRPQHIRFSLGLYTAADGPNGFTGTLALNRSAGSRPFGDHDREIVEVLQPHIAHYYRIFLKLGGWTNPSAARGPGHREADSNRSDVRRLRIAYGITEREGTVAELILSGYSNREIGDNLGISERTVEAHCLHIYNKIGINDRIELFLLARNLGIVPENWRR